MSGLLADLRYGVRMAVRRPGFTLMAAVTLALGIGANTAIFSVFDGVFLRPLPWKDPDRLVRIWESNPARGWPEFSVSLPNLIDWREQNRTFETIAASQGRSFNLTGTGDPERAGGAAVTPDLFPMLGADPAPGRHFLPEEATSGAPPVAIISHGLWQRRFGADPEIIGTPVTVNGARATIVGVLPESFDWFPGADLFVPLDLASDTRRGNHVLSVFARLRPGVTLDQAREDMEGIARRLAEQHPESNAGWSVTLSTFHEWIVGEDFRLAMGVLAGAVGLVLLIACSNVANLMLARGADRRREISIRASLGAGRLRIARQLLAESAVVSIAGGALGLLVAIWGVDTLTSLGPDGVPRIDEIGVDVRALLFAFGLALLTSLLFGMAPALQAMRADTMESLKEGGRGTEGARRLRLRGTLVAAEVGLSVVLLVGAGLLVRSFWRLQNVQTGFDPRQMLTFVINLPPDRYPSSDASADFHRRFLERLGSEPAVVSAAAANILPFEGGNTAVEVEIEGRPPEGAGSELPAADWRMISPGYFQTMRIPLLKGRLFTDSEVAGTPPVLIVSETMARRFWPDRDPVGRRLRASGSWFTIVGVAGDVRNLGLDIELRPVMYLPAWQNNWNPMSFAVRTRGEPSQAVRSVRAAVTAIDRDLPLSDISSMEEMIDRSLGSQRFNMTLLSVFAAIALVLAAVGIYGVVAWSVIQRTQEIGIRMALGARPADVLSMIVRQGSRMVVVGMAAGLAAAWALSRLMTGLLYGVTAGDPMTFLSIPALLGLVALTACYLPARRATRIDPCVALRHE